MDSLEKISLGVSFLSTSDTDSQVPHSSHLATQPLLFRQMLLHSYSISCISFTIFSSYSSVWYSLQKVYMMMTRQEASTQYRQNMTMEELAVVWNSEKSRMMMREMHRKNSSILISRWTVGNIWLFKVFSCYFIHIFPMLLLISGSVLCIIVFITSGSPSNSSGLLTGMKVLPSMLITQTSLREVGWGAFLSPRIIFFLQLFSTLLSFLEFIIEIKMINKQQQALNLILTLRLIKHPSGLLPYLIIFMRASY